MAFLFAGARQPRFADFFADELVVLLAELLAPPFAALLPELVDDFAPDEVLVDLPAVFDDVDRLFEAPPVEDLPPDFAAADFALPALLLDALPEVFEPVDLLPVDLAPEDLPPVDLLPVDLLPVDLLPVDLLLVDLLLVDLLLVDLLLLLPPPEVDLEPVDLFEPPEEPVLPSFGVTVSTAAVSAPTVAPAVAPARISPAASTTFSINLVATEGLDPLLRCPPPLFAELPLPVPLLLLFSAMIFPPKSSFCNTCVHLQISTIEIPNDTSFFAHV